MIYRLNSLCDNKKYMSTKSPLSQKHNYIYIGIGGIVLGYILLHTIGADSEGKVNMLGAFFEFSIPGFFILALLPLIYSKKGVPSGARFLAFLFCLFLSLNIFISQISFCDTCPTNVDDIRFAINACAITYVIFAFGCLLIKSFKSFLAASLFIILLLIGLYFITSVSEKHAEFQTMVDQNAYIFQNRPYDNHIYFDNNSYKLPYSISNNYVITLKYVIQPNSSINKINFQFISDSSLIRNPSISYYRAAIEGSPYNVTKNNSTNNGFDFEIVAKDGMRLNVSDTLIVIQFSLAHPEAINQKNFYVKVPIQFTANFYEDDTIISQETMLGNSAPYVLVYNPNI